MFVVHHDRRQCLLVEKVPWETQLPCAASQNFCLPIESVIYVTTLVCHFRSLLHLACGYSVEWATLTNEPTGCDR
jgi:hypothetical protein